jgi:hypothetical protein
VLSRREQPGMERFRHPFDFGGAND